jgi:hypothetical protein
MCKGIFLATFADRVDGQLSEEVRVTSGVPLVSVLLLLLFLAYEHPTKLKTSREL